MVEVLKQPQSDEHGLISELYLDTDYFQRTLCEQLMQIQFQKYSQELENLKA